MKKLIMVLTVTMIFFHLSCSWLPRGWQVEEILFDQETLEVEIGAREVLAVDIQPGEAASEAEVFYSIDNPAVATCLGTNSSVMISGVGEGTAILTATCRGISQSCIINVKSGNHSARYLTSDETTVVLESGKDTTLTSQLVNGTSIEEAEISWQIADPSICQLTGGGPTVILTPLAEGQTQILVTHPLSTNQLIIYAKVKHSDTALKLNPPFIVLDVGDETLLAATSAEPVYWTVNPPGVIRLLGTGNSVMVMANAPGTAVIQAATSTNTATCDVIVRSERMLAVSPTKLDITAGETAVAYLTYSPDDLEISMQNSNPAVASFDYDPSTGKIQVTGRDNGIATLNILADGMQRTLTVNVTVDYSIYCSPTILKIDPETPGSFNYVVSPEGFVPEFTVADNSVAEISVNPETRTVTVTALKEGSTTITGVVERESATIAIKSWYSTLEYELTHKILKKCDEEKDNLRAKYEGGTLYLVDEVTQQLTLSFPQTGVWIRDVEWSFSSDLYDDVSCQIFEGGQRTVWDFRPPWSWANHEIDGGSATVEVHWGDNHVWSKTIPLVVYIRNGG